MWTLLVFPRTVCEREQTWSLFVSFVELLEFACVKSERSVVPFFRLTKLFIVFTSDLEFCSVVMGRIGTLMVSVVSRRTRLPSHLLRLLGSSSGASRHNPSGNLFSWTTPKMTTCGCSEHSTWECCVWV